MHIILNLLINAVAIIVAAYLLPGVHVVDFTAALIAAIVLALVNAFLKPILVILTLPLTLLTFGLFILILNVLLVLLVSAIVPGFEVDGFLWAILFSIVLWVVNTALHMLESSFRAA
jgi:putative membrane protein